MLKRANQFTGYIFATALTLGALSAAATEIRNVVFFGDSLSDTGNVWFATGGLPPPPYFQGSSGAAPEFTGGQWSSPEGPSWPTLFAARFDLAATPSAVSVPTANNYSWGGARTGVGEPGNVPWLEQQVDQYLSPFTVAGTSISPETLISIMIGGNDVANNLANPANAISTGVTSIITQIQRLYAQGARQFLIANVPDVGATPRFTAIDAVAPGTAALATAVTAQWNAALDGAISQLALTDSVIYYFDFLSFSRDPELLALFANTTDACLTETSLCSDPASYFYWDTFHPSSTSHALLATGLFDTIVLSQLRQLVQNVSGVGPGNSLSSKAVAAQKAYAKTNYGGTCGALKALINQSKAQTGKKLSASVGSRLQTDAGFIMEIIDC